MPRTDDPKIPDDSPSPEGLRFRGLSREGRAFFRALESDPCPGAWPGGDRVAYAAHVLGPLKALVGDLARLLADVRPALVLEPRVGRSLYWAGRRDSSSADCPVRVVRTWDATSTPEESPVLYAAFAGSGIEVGLSAPLSGPPSGPLPGPNGPLDREIAALAGRGWRVSAGSGSGSRVFRALDWSHWIDEPGLAPELADRFRELLPAFDGMRSPSGARAS